MTQSVRRPTSLTPSLLCVPQGRGYLECKITSVVCHWSSCSFTYYFTVLHHSWYFFPFRLTTPSLLTSRENPFHSKKGHWPVDLHWPNVLNPLNVRIETFWKKLVKPRQSPLAIKNKVKRIYENSKHDKVRSPSPGQVSFYDS